MPYYPVCLAKNLPDPYAWGPPCDTAAEAFEHVRAAVDGGTATMGWVAHFSAQGKHLLPSRTYPPSCRKAVEKYLRLLQRLD